jgi:hypothetical protein
MHTEIHRFLVLGNIRLCSLPALRAYFCGYFLAIGPAARKGTAADDRFR